MPNSPVKALIATLLTCCAASASAAVINFNDLAGTAMTNHSGVNSLYTYFSSSRSATVGDYKFAPNQSTFYFIGDAYTSSDSWDQPYNGNDYLLLNNVTISSLAAAPFSLASFDLAAWDGWAATNHAMYNSLQMVGTYANGGTVTASYTVGGNNQGTTTGNDFTHFLATSQFSNLTSLSLTASHGGLMAIDNLDLRSGAVPEPATMALMGLGLAGIAAARRRRK